MRNLNLDQMGVQEMDAVELKKTDGGWWIPFLIGAIVNDWKDFKDGIRTGWEAAG